MNFKKLATLATTALAAVTLGACNMGEGIDQNTQGVTASEAGLRGATFDANDCVVQGMSRAEIGATLVLHDFSNSVTSLQKNMAGTVRNYSIAFNDVTNPQQQERIRAAHALLPASANCPAPVFPTATR